MRARVLQRIDDIFVVSLVARTIIALFAGFVFGLVGWLVAWLLIPFLNFAGFALPVVSSPVLGNSTSVGAASIFSDPRNSGKVNTLFRCWLSQRRSRRQR